jgi:hypothetical protein
LSCIGEVSAGTEREISQPSASRCCEPRSWNRHGDIGGGNKAEEGAGIEEPGPEGHCSRGLRALPEMSYRRRDSGPWEQAAAVKRPPMPPSQSSSVPLPPRGVQGVQIQQPRRNVQQPGHVRYESPPQVNNRGVSPRQSQAYAGGWAGSPPLLCWGLE